MYVAEKTLTNALQSLNSTADHMLKIWLTLKHMGLSDKMPPVEIDTNNSTPSLKRLFSYGEPSGGFSYLSPIQRDMQQCGMTLLQ